MKLSIPLWLLLILLALTACSRPQPPAPPTPKVTVVYPQVGTVTNWDEYPGHIEAVEMVEIRPRVSGYIESIHFEDGAEMKAGDLLFVIDPRPYQAELNRARAERQRAETRVELARNDLRRVEGLRGTKAISEEEYDSRSKALREAEAALAAARATEAAAQLNLDYTQIKAPINGRIGRRLVTVGNLVQGGGMVPGTIMATMVSMDPVYCYFDADEASFLRYRAHSASVKNAPLPCELALVNQEGFPNKGRVDFFDNQVNARTGTIRMRGTFANPDRALVPGMFAKVRVPAGPPVQALLVPAVAIGSDQGNKFVMVVNKDSVVEPRPIEVDRQHGAMRAVTKGLTPQDRVVVNGLMMERPGAKVEVVEASPKGPVPAATAKH
ncbi:MAG: efflux RND transporter periplasmic adaptor subunit [Verrucomicrobiae bacterium]|nr:efflux RND transporter periplasmic adaptor subunit [Verrucomicrobiae bacterium]